eukprot:gene12114-biopygen10969
MQRRFLCSEPALGALMPPGKPGVRKVPVPPQGETAVDAGRRGPDADCTIEFKESDADRTRTGRWQCRSSPNRFMTMMAPVASMPLSARELLLHFEQGSRRGCLGGSPYRIGSV